MVANAFLRPFSFSSHARTHGTPRSGHVFGERDGGVFGRNFARRETLRVLGRENLQRLGDEFVSGENSKKNDVDLVTATDEKCEKMVKECISEAFPEHSIVGEEETARAGDVILNERTQPTWHDTTRSMGRRRLYPLSKLVRFNWSVRERRTIVGVVFNPMARDVCRSERKRVRS